MGHKAVLSDITCDECGLLWCKNFQYLKDGNKRHNGYYHRCGASESGRFDGDGPFVRVGLDMKPNGWTDKYGCYRGKDAVLRVPGWREKLEKGLARAS